MGIRLAQRKMAETTDSGKPTAGEIIHANDVYSKDTVDNLIRDPTYNTPSACVGYGQDVLGGY